MKRRCLISVFMLLFCLLFSGCTDKENQAHRAQIFAMDTVMDLTVYGERGEEAIVAAREKIEEAESLFSVTEEKSDVARINAASGSAVAVANETEELIQKSLSISKETEGLFDISIYPVVKAWGFTGESPRVPSESERLHALEQVDYRKIKCKGGKVQLKQEMQIDLGGIAKGYTSACLADMFQEMGISSALISLGGNVEAIGKKPDDSPFVVGIKNPFSPNSLIGTVEVENKAVVTSGSYERQFSENGQTYHHVMDKETGAPAQSDIVSVTVISEDATRADALSTALFIMGSTKAIEYQKKHDEVGIVLIKKDKNVYISDNYKKVFHLSENEK